MRLSFPLAALLAFFAFIPLSSQQTLAFSETGTGDNTSTIVAQISPRASLVVTSLADSGGGTLRDAMLAANATPEADTITFAVTGTITLATNLPPINQPLTITGPGVANLTITGGSTTAFRVDSGSFALGISGLTLTGMNVGVYTTGPAVTLTDMVFSNITARAVTTSGGSLDMTRVTVTGNTGLRAIYTVNTTVTIAESTISGSAQNAMQIDGGTITITGSTFANNTGATAGAIYVRETVAASVNITNSTFANNTGDGAGAIYAASNVGPTTVNITNSTFSGNAATSSTNADAIYAYQNATVNIAFSTFSGHSNSTTSSTIGILAAGTNADITLNASIIANNPAGGTPRECTAGSGATFTGSGNLTNDTICPGRITAPTSVSATLADNGGPTRTHALLAGSNAIDAYTGAACPATDQRGETRPAADTDCDLGAYEFPSAPVCPTSPATIPAGDVAALIFGIDCANASSSNDVIELTGGSTYLLTVTHNATGGNNGLPVIASAATAGTLTINGNGATISGNNERRVLYVLTGANLTLNNLTVANGSVTTNGGGIWNGGTVALNRSTVRDNGSTNDGGGIYNTGTATLTNSTVTGNTTTGWGGGIASYSPAVLTLKNSTIAQNSAISGGGLSASGSATVHNTILAANTATGSPDLDCRGTVTARNSLFQTGSCGILTGPNGNRVGTGPGLTLVTPVDGSPAYYTINPSGVAVNTGSNALVPAGVTTDQPGNPRVQGIIVDMGSYEVYAPPCPVSGDTIPAGDMDTLIYAIECANASPANETFELTNSTYTLTAPYAGTTGLPAANDAAASGTLTINGNGATINGGALARLFSVGLGGNLTLNEMTITNGRVTDSDSGGAISNASNSGVLTLTGVTITNSFAGSRGGAIYNAGTITVTDSIFSGSSASFGGAIYNARTATITGSTFSGNTATDNGGGIYNVGVSLGLTNSTVTGNTAMYGGALYMVGSSTVVTMVNSTLALNDASGGGGILINSGSLQARNSIIAGNTSNTGVNSDCNRVGGSSTSANSLYQNGACGATNGVSGNIVGQNPLLGALTGSPAYFPLLAGSPAINVGGNALVPAGLDFDQAGNPRIQGGTVDLGSFETNTPAFVPEINVTGNGENIADGDTTPNTFDHTDFGTTPTGTPATRTFTIHNTGTGALNLGSITVPSGFTLAAPLPGSSVAAGGSVALNVRCDATASGVYFGTVSIPNGDADENPYNFDVDCWVSGPEIEIYNGVENILSGDTTPSTADGTDFGTVVTGSPTGQSFTILNTGSEPLNISAVTVPAGFTVTTAPPASIAAGTSAPLGIRCDATAAGTFSGAVSLTSNDADENPFTFAITCTVLAPDINITGNSVSIASGDFTPDAADHTAFGTTTVGTPVTRTFTIGNNGTAALNIVGISVPVGFTLANPLPSPSVAVGASTALNVQCAAFAASTYTGSVIIDTNDPDESPYTFAITCTVDTVPPPTPDISVTGNGVVIANGDITPSLADHTDFGTTTLGSPVWRVFTIHNNGDGELQITNGSLPSGFMPATPTPDTVIAAGSSTALGLECPAMSVGTISGTLVLESNDPDTPSYSFGVTCEVTMGVPPDINITGNGVTIANGDTTPVLADHTDFGVTTVGTSVVRTYTIENTGGGPLMLTGFAGPMTGFTGAGSPPSSTIPAGGSTTFSLACEAAAVGTYGGTLSISSTDPDESPYTFDITCQVDASVPDGITITESGGTTAVTEAGGIDSYAVALDTQPSADVLVTLNFSGQITANASASPVILTFTPANWNIAQTVTVAAVNDSSVEGPHGASITYTVASADAGYDGMSLTDTTVLVTDNDTATITFASPGGSVSEGTANYYAGIVLTITSDPAGGTLASPVTYNFNFIPGSATPGADFSLPVSAGGFGAGSGSGTSLGAGAAIVNDLIDEADEMFTIVFSGSSGPVTVSGTHAVTILDNDTAGMNTLESNGSTVVTEDGATDAYLVGLNTQPAADVVVTLTFSGQVTVYGAPSPVVLTFTPANWSTKQPVPVGALNDSLVEGPHSTAISHSVASADPKYNGLTMTDIAVSITDNDTASIVFASPANANSEAVTPYQDSAVLLIQSDPVGGTLAAPVTVGLLQTPGTAATPADYTLATSSLMFPAGAANGATQPFTAAIVNDALDEPDETFSLSFGTVTGPATASGTHTVTILDDDSAGVTVTESGITSVAEGGATDTYTVALTSVPSADVTVTLTFDGQITVNGSASPVALTFSDMTPQTVTVAAVNDSSVESPFNAYTTVTAVITQSASSADSAYNVIDPADVSVHVTDNDTASLTFETATGSATEGMSPYTVNVVLSVVSDPAGGTLASDFETMIVNMANTAAYPADYTNMTPWITIPAGAAHGTMLPVSVAIVDDALPENDETFELGFGFSNVPASGVHTVTILASDLGNLLQNPGFETAGTGITKATKWKSAVLTRKDKRVCDTATKTFSNSGDCAFRFQNNGVLTVSRVVKQTVKNPAQGVVGENYTLDAMISASSLTPGAKLILQVKYANGTKTKGVINVPSGTYGYTAVETALPITRSVTWVRVKLVGGTTSGRLLIDDLVLWVEPGAAATATRANDALLPLPAAPDGFRSASTMP